MPTKRVYVQGVVAPTVVGAENPRNLNDKTECSPPPAAAVYSAAKVMPSARTVSLDEKTRALIGAVPAKVMLRPKPKKQLSSAELLRVFVVWLIVGGAMAFFGYMVYEIVGDYIAENAPTTPSIPESVAKPALPAAAPRTPFPVYVAPKYELPKWEAKKNPRRRHHVTRQKHKIRSKKHFRP